MSSSSVSNVFFPLDADSLSSLPPMSSSIKEWNRDWTPGPLTPDELKHFFEYGYVLKNEVFSASELQPTMDSISLLVDNLARRLFAAGKIKDLCENEDFYTRLTALEKQFPSLSVLMHRQGVLSEAMKKLWTSKQLLGIAGQVLGENLAGHPVWNLRTKTPQQEQANVPWHQDAAYLDSIADNVLQLTAWIPFINASVKNGCMQVLKGGHRTGVVCPHVGCTGGTWYIETVTTAIPNRLGVDLDRDLVTVEVPMGSILLLNNLIPHRSLPNLSNQIRWSLDLRWQKPDLPNGYYGLKEVIVFRQAKSDGGSEVDWDSFSSWASVDRSRLQDSGVMEEAKQSAAAEEDPFETRICGPWMDRWPLVHQNRHTDHWLKLNAGTTPEERMHKVKAMGKA